MKYVLGVLPGVLLLCSRADKGKSNDELPGLIGTRVFIGARP